MDTQAGVFSLAKSFAGAASIAVCYVQALATTQARLAALFNARLNNRKLSLDRPGP
jgi:hypothetical protein